MKYLLLITALFLAHSSFAQKDTVGLNLPVNNGHVIYEQIIDANNKSKADLYKNAKQWFVDYFKSSKDVIQNEDKEAGRIVGKGIVEVPFRGALGNTVYYSDNLTLQVDCRDNKYRFKIYDMILKSKNEGKDQVIITPEDLIAKLTGNGKSIFNDKQARRILESVNTTANGMVTDFKKAMAVKTDDF